MATDPYEIHVEECLATFARELDTDRKGVEWHTEFHRSRHYSLAGNLVFSPLEAPERELAVVSVQLKPEAGWTFDAIDEGAVIKAEAQVAASANLPTVVQELSAFLVGARPLVLAALVDA